MRIKFIVLSVLLGAIVGYCPAHGESWDEPALVTDELTGALNAYLDERVAGKTEAFADAVVDEVFDEPDLARIKVKEVYLRAIEYRRNHPDRTIIIDERLRILNRRLDAQDQANHRSRLVKEAITSSVNVLIGGTVLGALGLDDVEIVMDRFMDTESADGQNNERLGNHLFEYDNKHYLSYHLHQHPQPAEDVLKRDLRELGLADSAIEGLKLAQTDPNHFPYAHFEKTNLPGLSYAPVRSRAHGGHRLVLGLTPSLLGHLRVWFISQEVSVEQIQVVLAGLRFRDARDGGKNFAALIDPETRRAFPTRLAYEELAREADLWDLGMHSIYDPLHQNLSVRKTYELLLFAARHRFDSPSPDAEAIYRQSLLGLDKNNLTARKVLPAGSK